MKDKIEDFKHELSEYVHEIEFNDEILQRLYIQIYERVCNDLTTLWFYHTALKSRIK